MLLLLILLISFASCQKAQEPVADEHPNWTQYGTPYENIPATEDIVMYEVNIRAFSPEGDLNGVRARLDEIRALGVNVIWLMPIHPIGQERSVNSPYSVRDYYAVGAEYGSLEDLRRLTTEAHARDMAVILDWVANHTAWDHPWIGENPHWYMRDGSGNIQHPAGTNWYDVAELNFSNPDMRLAMIDAMTYWVLEANVDGYRCDYADGVPFDFWRQAWDSLSAIPGRRLIAFAEGARIDHFAAGFELNFGWAWYDELKRVFAGQPATRLTTTHNNQYAQIPEGKHQLRFTTNHDESAWDQTPMVIFNGRQGAMAAFVVTTFMGGVPLIYSSQETGRVENLPFFSNVPINWNANPGIQNEYRQIMQAYNSSQAAKQQDITSYSSTDLVCFSKSSMQEQLLVITNVRNFTRSFPVPEEFSNTTWTNSLTGETITLDAPLELSPYQYLILQKSSPATDNK